MTLGRRFHCNLALRVVEAGNLFRISGLVLRASGQRPAFWLCLGLFSPSVQFDFFLISPCSNSVYTHLTFLQIGFVLHKTLKMVFAFSADHPVFGVNRRGRKERREDGGCISLLCHELHVFSSAASAFSVVRNTYLEVASHEKNLLVDYEQ